MHATTEERIAKLERAVDDLEKSVAAFVIADSRRYPATPWNHNPRPAVAVTPQNR